MLNKQDERLLQELLKKYKQGYISGLIQGDNINLTPSGCRNKIISSTGGGGSSLFIDHFRIIESPSDYISADANGLLEVVDTTVTIPEIFPFVNGDKFVVQNGFGDSVVECNYQASKIELHLAVDETVLFFVLVEEGIGNSILPITKIIYDTTTSTYMTDTLYQETYLSNSLGTLRVNLGSITYTAINNATATQTISLETSIVSEIPAGYYLDRLVYYIETDNSFLSVSTPAMATALAMSEGIALKNLEAITETQLNTAVAGSLTYAGSGTTSLEIFIDFGIGNTNPQDFTQGEVKFVAYCEPLFVN